MKVTLITLLLATACGSDTTELEQCGAASTLPKTELVRNEPLPDTDRVEPMDSVQLSGVSEIQNVNPSSEVQALCISPDPKLLRFVRDSIGRFGERLEIPMVLGEGCLPITVQETVRAQGKPQSGVARYSGAPCQWKDCESRAVIEIAAINLTDQVEWLPNLLDHEIGHVLSSWGSVLHVDQHIQEDGHIMSVLNKRTNQWTQEDVDMWCSASPCGKTRMDPSWFSPVSVGGTSYISDEGRDGGVPADAGPLSDAN